MKLQWGHHGEKFFQKGWGCNTALLSTGNCKHERPLLQVRLSGVPAYAGAAPFMLGERGFKKLQNRKTKVASYNFDLNLILDYWGCFGKR